MPVTWFAHQVPIAPLKLARPAWFDATALCVGSMTPDLMYSFSGYIGIDTHQWPASVVVGLPFALALTVLLRYVVAPGVAPALPDLGSFRLRSFGVLADRTPHPATTAVSALVGIASHVWVDWFTHPGRPGARWLGYDDVDVTVAGHTEPLSGVLQILGHTVGSAVGIWLLWRVGRDRLLETWYGDEAVRRARRRRPRLDARWLWVLVAAGLSAGFAWGLGETFSVARAERLALGALSGATAFSIAERVAARRNARADATRPLTRL